MSKCVAVALWRKDDTLGSSSDARRFIDAREGTPYRPFMAH
jgi:hypothetical protein